MKDDTTICIEALTAWPVEARPKELIRDSEAWYDFAECIYLPEHRAIDLFIASGLRWYAQRRGPTVIYPPSEDDSNWSVMPLGGTLCHGPTLLSAIDAAIRTIAKENDHV